MSYRRQTFAKKFAERPPAKKSMQAAGFSDVFAKNFAQNFHPLDKHNSVKKKTSRPSFWIFPAEHLSSPSYRSKSRGFGSPR